MFSNQPSWLKHYRDKNRLILKEMPLKKSQYFNVAELNQSLSVPQDLQVIEIPKHLEKKGLRVLTWKEALLSLGDKIKFILEKEEPPKNQYEAFINSNFNTGFIIIAGQDASKDIIEYAISAEKNSIIKNIIILQKNTQDLKLLQHLSQDINYLNQTVFLEENSKLAHIKILNIKDKAIINNQNFLEKDARLITSNVFLGGEKIHSRILNYLNGEGSQLNEFDLSYLDNKQFVNLDLKSIHKAQNAQSHSILKTVLNDNSSNLFDGMIKILPSGQKSNALLEAHSLLLSKDASANNIPSLEIQADDVKATHSATVSNLDEEQLFYLESKGLSRVQARHQIVKGFIESLILALPKEYTQPLTSLVEQKLK